MKWVFRLLIGLVALVVVVFGAAAIFLATIDANDYKDLIAKKVNEATGRTLTIDGDIELSFFPWLGLVLGQAQLSNAPGFGDEPFARVTEVQVKVALLPLFRREVQADTVSLKGLRLNLSRSRDGVTNWHDLVKKESAERPSQPEEPMGEAPAAALAIAVGGIDVRDAALSWRDEQTGNVLLVSPFGLQAGAVKPGEPFDLTMDVAVNNQKPPLKATAKLLGEVTAEPRQQRYRFDGLVLRVNAEGESLPGGGRLEGELRSTVVADLQAQTLSVSPLTVEGLDLVLNGQLEVSQLHDTPKMTGSLRVAPFSPRELLGRLAMPEAIPADPSAMQQAALELRFEGNASAVNLSELKLALDDSTMTGNARVEPIDEARIRFSLALDQMDIDRYLPPPTEASGKDNREPGGTADPGASAATLGLPVDALRDLDVVGDLKAGRLKVSNLELSKVIAELRANRGLVSLKPLSTALYGGHLDSSLVMDVRGKSPVFNALANLNSVQMGPLVAALQEGKGYIDGTGTFSANLQTRGERIADLRRVLAGKLNLAIRDGALYDKKLAAKVEAAVAFLEGRPPRAAGEALIFESLSGSATIKAGVLDNRDLALITPLILGKGEGTANLGEETLDYTLSLALAGGGEDKKRVFVPVTVKGPFADLKYGVKLRKLATEKLKSEAEKRIGKELEKVAPELGAPLQEGLKGLFGR